MQPSPGKAPLHKSPDWKYESGEAAAHKVTPKKEEARVRVRHLVLERRSFAWVRELISQSIYATIAMAIAMAAVV